MAIFPSVTPVSAAEHRDLYPSGDSKLWLSDWRMGGYSSKIAAAIRRVRVNSEFGIRTRVRTAKRIPLLERSGSRAGQARPLVTRFSGESSPRGGFFIVTRGTEKLTGARR